MIALPIPNGVWLPARGAAERAMAARLPGAPDLVLLWEGGGALVELKRPKTQDLFGTRAAGRPNEAQVAVTARAVELGIRHAYCSSWDDLRARLAEWGVVHAG